MTSRARLVAILALGALAQVAVFFIFSEPPARPLLGDEVRYHAEARVLLAGGDVPHDFFWPPFHARFVAGLLGVSGGSLLGPYVVQGALVLLSGLLLRGLLRGAGAGEVAADLAAGLFLVDPQLQFFALSLWPETLHLALLLLGTALLATGRTFGAGAVFGASLLVKSLLLPFLPVLALVAACTGRPGFREGLRRAALLGLGVFVTAGAVSVRNGLVTGTYGIANSGVYNLWVGLEDPTGTAD
ncbi:MAG: hypothetical protein JNK60_00970 [Acidobacteria bacterium]|nr:hypothetical protein [Acidobacteriota bacterium]